MTKDSIVNNKINSITEQISLLIHDINECLEDYNEYITKLRHFLDELSKLIYTILTEDNDEQIPVSRIFIDTDRIKQMYMINIEIDPKIRNDIIKSYYIQRTYSILYEYLKHLIIYINVY